MKVCLFYRLSGKKVPCCYSGRFLFQLSNHDKYICNLHLSIIIGENKEGQKKKGQKKGLSYVMAHAFKKQMNSYNVS